MNQNNRRKGPARKWKKRWPCDLKIKQFPQECQDRLTRLQAEVNKSPWVGSLLSSLYFFWVVLGPVCWFIVELLSKNSDGSKFWFRITTRTHKGSFKVQVQKFMPSRNAHTVKHFSTHPRSSLATQKIFFERLLMAQDLHEFEAGCVSVVLFMPYCQNDVLLCYSIMFVGTLCLDSLLRLISC